MMAGIITALIGASATILAALISVRREQRQFRQESNSQHGVLLDRVNDIWEATADIADDLKVVKETVEVHDRQLNEILKPPMRTATNRKR